MKLISSLHEFLRSHEVIYSLFATILLLSVFFVVIYFFEARHGTDKKRYLSKNFATDLAYNLFYRGGLFTFFIFAPIMSFLQPRLTIFDAHLAYYLPLPLAWAAYYVLTDFIGYWYHRLEHTNRFLWAFHSLHHSQVQMTFMTSYRIHFIEQTVLTIMMLVPVALLGVPQNVWLPVVFLMTFHQAVQHADLEWRFGFLYPILTSPVFHSIHHSVDPAHHDRNFGMTLTCWDYLFGTAVKVRERPKAFGVEGWNYPESLVHHTIAPFKMLYNARAERAGRQRASFELTSEKSPKV